METEVFLKMEELGWEFTPTDDHTWRWVKFHRGNPIATFGDETWIKDFNSE